MYFECREENKIPTCKILLHFWMMPSFRFYCHSGIKKSCCAICQFSPSISCYQTKYQTFLSTLTKIQIETSSSSSQQAAEFSTTQLNSRHQKQRLGFHKENIFCTQKSFWDQMHIIIFLYTDTAHQRRLCFMTMTKTLNLFQSECCSLQWRHDISLDCRLQISMQISIEPSKIIQDYLVIKLGVRS